MSASTSHDSSASVVSSSRGGGSQRTPFSAPSIWMMRRLLHSRLAVWPLLAFAVAAIIARMLVPIAELRVALWWGTHVGVAAAGTAIGRLLLKPANGALIAQSPAPLLGWWLRSLGFLVVLTFAWLILSWVGLGFDPRDSAARIFFGMAALASMTSFAASAAMPSRPFLSVLFGVGLWFVFYLFAEGAPDAARSAGGQSAFAMWVIAITLGVSYFGMSRRLHR